MPNWCSNTLTVTHSKGKIDALESFLKEKDGKNFFDFFVEPQNDNDSGWYAYNLENYGCKWNCDTDHWERTSDNTIDISFQSPWSPPIQLYENMLTGDFEVYAEYHECGMAFVGKYDNGFDESFEYLEGLDGIPEELVENWNLEEEIALYEEDEDERSSN